MQVEAYKEMQTHKHRYTKTWSLLAGWPPMEAKARHYLRVDGDKSL